MKFSIIIPTRNRPKMLLELMASIVSRTSNLKEVEFLFKIDDDDVSSEYVQIMADAFGSSGNIFKYEFFVGARSGNIVNDYYNYLAQQSKGDYVWALNDDCLLYGPDDWDLLVLDEINSRGLNNKIVYVNVGVSGHTDVFAPFPILSREAINALGYFHNTSLKTWDADVVLWNIFNGLKNNSGIDRMIDIRTKMTIVHFNGNGQRHDDTREHMKVNHMANGGLNAGDFNGAGLYPPEIKKLHQAIKDGK